KTDAMRHLVWRVAYAPGTLHAVARRGGRVITTSDVRTAGRGVRVKLEPDRASIHGDGKDLSFVTVTVVDDHGTAVPTADNLVHFRIDGPATIAGVDNGDQVSHAPMKANSVRLFNGKGLLIVQSKRAGGMVTVRASSEGLADGSTRLTLSRNH
ncbi:MAG TPA: DUF4982 domain-containing protein, partial [Gemmatimonadaceae bacterium]|nr:DUF4982 domain-containing protein [Gemmatimonadaceae bacterium]